MGELPSSPALLPYCVREKGERCGVGLEMEFLPPPNLPLKGEEKRLPDLIQKGEEKDQKEPPSSPFEIRARSAVYWDCNNG